MRRTREQWAKLVAAFETAGEPVAEFCAERGLVPATFRWWQRQLRSAAPAAARSDEVRLVPVNLMGMGRQASPPVVVAVADVAVRIEVGTDVEYVAALVGRLRRA